MLKTRTHIVSLLTALLFTLPGAAPGQDPPGGAMGVIKPRVRVEAPNFTLEDIDGNPRRLNEFKGNVILLNFWATFCAPCREEMPAMERLWKELKDQGLVIIAVAGDRGRKSMHKVKEFCVMHGMSFPVLLDPRGEVRRSYEVTALPTSYIIGRDGKISGKIIGARQWDTDESKKLFNALLIE